MSGRSMGQPVELAHDQDHTCRMFLSMHRRNHSMVLFCRHCRGPGTPNVVQYPFDSMPNSACDVHAPAILLTQSLPHLVLHRF